MSSETTSPMPLADTTWRVTAYQTPDRRLTPVLDGTEVTARFFADGRLAGKSGCNSYRANCTGDDRRLHIGPVATTRMLCPAPPGVMEQERAYIAALALASIYTVDTGELTLAAENGESVVKCERIAD